MKSNPPLISTQPNARTEFEEIRQLLHIPAPNMDTLDWEDIVAVEAVKKILTHMLHLEILVIRTFQHRGCIILQKMIHTVFHHHPYLHQTTQLTMNHLYYETRTRHGSHFSLS